MFYFIVTIQPLAAAFQ